MGRSSFHGRARRGLLLVGVAAGVILVATAAAAQGPHRVRIAGGPLDAALLALAAQSHEQLLYPPELVAGRRAAPLDGVMTAEQALRRLLARTGIVAARVGPDVLVLRRPGKAGAPSEGPGAAVAASPSPEAVARRPFGGDAPGASAAADGRPLPPGASSDAGAGAAVLSTLEVTGTHIRGGRTASPILTLDRDAIDRSGHATVAEALGALPQNFSGVATEGTVLTGADKAGQNVAYASSVNLRGLGPQSTLVLVNGRRVAGAGSFASFADLSNLPSGAVQRVDLLFDGASALYGADAVGGVVNVILRRDLDGAETRVVAGAATRGAPEQLLVSQLLGRRWSGGGLLLAYEYEDRTRLAGAKRDFAADADLRRFGGTDQRLTTAFPGNILVGNQPAFAVPAGQPGVGLTPAQLLPGVVNLGNQRAGEDILPSQRRNTAYVAVDQDLGDRLSLSADARYSRRNFAARMAPVASTFTVSRANPFFVSPNGSASDTIAYSFLDQTANPLSSGWAENLGGTVGGTLKLFGDWRAEGYLAEGREREQVRNTGLLNSAALSEALGNVPDNPATPFSTAGTGFFNPFTGVPGANRPAVLAFVTGGYTSSESRSEVRSADLQADGTLFRLPTGRVKLAVGLQGRRESLAASGVNFLSTVAPSPQQAVHESRTVAAGFVELQASLVDADHARPGLQRLDLTLSGRVERYSDVGRTSNPQVGLLWSPVTGVNLRATYGRSFRAPALSEAHQSATFTAGLLPLNGVRVPILLLQGGNPGLRPETADTWTAGVDLAPAALPGLHLGLTAFDVQFQERIDRPVLSNILGSLSDPALATFVRRISPASNPADLGLINGLLADPAASAVPASFTPQQFQAVVDARYVNTSALHVRGLDLEVGYRRELGRDVVSLGGSATYLLKYDQQLTPTTRPAPRLGLANFPVRLRARVVADWTHGPATVQVALNHVAAYHDAFGVRIGAQHTVDGQLRLAAPDTGPWRGVSAALSVRNLLDARPPFYNNIAGVAYDPANADPIGRFVSLQLTKRW